MTAHTIDVLDIGTTKIIAVAAHCDGDTIVIDGVGQLDGGGVADGDIRDIETVAALTKQVLAIAAQQAGRPITEVAVGLAGAHIHSCAASLRLAVTHAENGLHGDRYQRLLTQLREQMGHRIRQHGEKHPQLLHEFTTNWRIDGAYPVHTPLHAPVNGYVDCDALTVWAPDWLMRKVRFCLRRAGVQPTSFALDHYASAYATLRQSEYDTDADVLCIDIGGGTTDVLLLHNGIPWHVCNVAYAGHTISEAVSKWFGVSRATAQSLIREHGHVTDGNDDATVTVMTDYDETTVAAADLADVLRMCYRQLLHQVRVDVLNAVGAANLLDEIDAEQQHTVNAHDDSGEHNAIGDCLREHLFGIVCTGGGAEVAGLSALTAQMFGVRARVAAPLDDALVHGDDLSTPRHATAVGLLRLAAAGVGGRPPGRWATWRRWFPL